MTPGVFHGVHEQSNLEKQIERQIGCMTGFLQIFDRHQILSGKRFFSEKRLPSYPAAGSTSPSERSEVSSVSLVKEAQPSSSCPSQDGCPFSPEKHSPTNTPGRQTLPLPVFALDGQKNSWKLREAPRLSLDSRATVDVKGKLRPREIRISPMVFSGKSSVISEDGENQEKQRRSPSVVARLMGLEALPDAGYGELPKSAELRRSASESRVPRDLLEFNFQKPAPKPSEDLFGPHKIYSWETRAREIKHKGPKPPPSLLVRKSFFDSQEFFPEPKRTGSLYGQIEKRLRMRGIEEPAKDLETLKQILEALQLKGLLHSKPPEPRDARAVNVLYERRTGSSASFESPIFVMKPAPKSRSRSPRSDLPNPTPRSLSPRPFPAPESVSTTIPQRRRLEIDQNLSSLRRQNFRSQKLTETSNPIASPARRRAPQPQQRIPAVHSPKISPKSLGSRTTSARSSRCRLQTAVVPPKEAVYSLAEEEISTQSDASIFSSPSQSIYERATVDEYRTGRSLLERCDKLLQSIAAITSSAEQVTAGEQQPSPVSVLDSYLSDDSFASPFPKPAVDFKDQLADWVKDQWNHQVTSTVGSKSDNGTREEMAKEPGEDYAYVADVILESDRHRTAADAFAAIEKRHQSSISSEMHRRLVFDFVTEILYRKRHVTPWEAFCCGAASASAGGNGSGGGSILREVWEELRRVQQCVASEDVMVLTRGIIQKDMTAAAAGEQGWEVAGAEMSEAVLHIERQLFRDLVADTIRELADLAGSCRHDAFPRRKLVF